MWLTSLRTSHRYNETVKDHIWEGRNYQGYIFVKKIIGMCLRNILMQTFEMHLSNQPRYLMMRRRTVKEEAEDKFVDGSIRYLVGSSNITECSLKIINYSNSQRQRRPKPRNTIKIEQSSK